MAATAPVRAMKKLINAVEDVVPESLEGLGLAHADLVRIDAANNVVLRKDAPQRGKVALLSGGGSGHEPLHGGFVGLGMLDAACAGNVFTSPVPDQMEAATRAVDGGAGVLHIVKNYTGDVLNFQMAADLVAGDVEVADGRHRRRRRGPGLAVHRGTPGRRGHGAGREDRRRPGRGGRLARRRRRDRGEGQRQRALDGHGLDIVHRPRRRHADVRHRRRRGRDRDRDPRRAGSPTREAHAGRRHRGDRWSRRSWPTWGSRRGDRVLAFVNGMGGTPLIELYIAYQQRRESSTGRASRSPGTSSGATSRASRWPASR